MFRHMSKLFLPKLKAKTPGQHVKNIQIILMSNITQTRYEKNNTLNWTGKNAYFCCLFVGNLLYDFILHISTKSLFIYTRAVHVYTHTFIYESNAIVAVLCA